ncbi:unnamed protein product, partial [Onchocerca flexuosa]|uniref:Uncharacterized protein n=1 Tax=Onchocerca flexuosa TaxID=387005 RepID=A0A183HVV2_9BILA
MCSMLELQNASESVFLVKKKNGPIKRLRIMIKKRSIVPFLAAGLHLT